MWILILLFIILVLEKVFEIVVRGMATVQILRVAKTLRQRTRHQIVVPIKFNRKLSKIHPEEWAYCNNCGHPNRKENQTCTQCGRRTQCQGITIDED